MEQVVFKGRIDVNTDHIELLRGSCNVHFIRVFPQNHSDAIKQLLKLILDYSWLSKIERRSIRDAFQRRAEKTVQKIQQNIEDCKDDKITSQVAEYIVSTSALSAIADKLHYETVPLSELLGKKISRNPGFDYHCWCPCRNILIFGEAKYIADRSAYISALTQIIEFISVSKDVEDLPDIEHFVPEEVCANVTKEIKGFSAAFSCKNLESSELIKNIKNRPEYSSLLQYKELILVAVNL